MNRQPIYDSRDTRYKTPYGAVPAGTAVQFTLRPPRDAGISRARLVATFEFRDNQTITLDMPWCDLELGRDLFRATLDTTDYIGLVWYSFELENFNGQVERLGTYQLTVYDPAEQVPSWYGEGMCYQIFPDRFRRTRIPDPTGLVGGRWVHPDWSDHPEYRPDPKGEVRNRDFFGGDFAGIIEKLDYLKELGVETIYFNPIFEAAENHRYGTADYDRIDPMLGTNEDFTRLCDQAHQRGMRVMLDGVFNHTGSTSRYFNADGFYPEVGAAQSTDSPYAPWYHFTHWPDAYDSWWGIRTLPAVNENHSAYRDFIISGENSVVRHWLRCGASGWRLDVADELPDDFIADIRRVMTEERADSYLLGEVWEDGSNKIAYSQRRRYLLGHETHGLMNYPFRSAALSWLLGGDAAEFREIMESLREHYPPAAFYGGMNFLGTHDTPRILTLLGLSPDADTDTRDKRAAYWLDTYERQLGLSRLRLGAMLLYSFPGSPTVFYGDEVGMQGFEDPFNRGTFPWGHEDAELLQFYRTLGTLRSERNSLQSGNIAYLYASGGGLVLQRKSGDEVTYAALNAGDAPLTVSLPCRQHLLTDALSGQQFLAQSGFVHLTLPPVTGLLLI